MGTTHSALSPPPQLVSPSPVKRRESPWGVSEGDHRQPTPHRCNDHVEDVIQMKTSPPTPVPVEGRTKLHRLFQPLQISISV